MGNTLLLNRILPMSIPGRSNNGVKQLTHDKPLPLLTPRAFIVYAGLLLRMTTNRFTLLSCF